MDSPAGQEPFPPRPGKTLPILLAALSLVLLAGTYRVIFIQLPGIQEAVREIAGQLASPLAAGLPAMGSVPFHLASSSGVWEQTVLFLAAAAWITCWLLLVYRLARDARSLGGSRMQHTPGKCVLSFLLPVGNMWMPLKSLLDMNAIFSPARRKSGIALIWTAWAVSVPIALLAFLYTLSVPFITLLDTFRNWEGQEDLLTPGMMERDIQNVFNSLVEPMLLYNGIVFMLSILLSSLMVLYLDSRRRRMFPPIAK